MNLVKKIVQSQESKFFVLYLVSFLSLFVGKANSAGGLDRLDTATNALQEILDWLKVFVIVGAVLYLVYLVAMALMEKKSWNDVIMGGVYCVVAGGIVYAGEWATTLWD